MLTDDYTTPLTRMFAAKIVATNKGEDADFADIIPTSVQQIWFTGNFDYHIYMFQSDDWKVRVTVRRAGRLDRTYEALRAVHDIEIIEHEDNIVRDLGFLRLKGREELFEPIVI